MEWHKAHLRSVLWQAMALLLLSPYSTQLCPDQCQCHGNNSSGQVKVSCADLSLTAVPIGLPQNTTILNLHGNLISNLSQDNLDKLPEGLTEIDLGHNKITEVGENFLQNLKQLTKLSLDSNQIQVIQPGAFQHLHSLRNLNLAKNQMEMLQAELFFGLTELRLLNLSENFVSNIENSTFHELDSLMTLDLSFNKHLSLTNTSLLGCSGVHTLYLQGSELDAIAIQALDGMKSLVYLDLSHNSIPYVNRSTFPSLQSLQHLVLTNSSIGQLEPNAFYSFPELVNLTLDHNPFKEIVGGTLAGLSHLETLSISYLPHLYYIYSKAFDSLPSLRVLLIHNNPRLAYLHYNLFHGLHRLTYLDLSFNNITRVHENVYSKFKSVTVDVNGNYLLCDCELDWILQTIFSYSTDLRVTFQNVDKLNCSFEDNLSDEYPLWNLSTSDLKCHNLSTNSSQNNSLLFFPIGKSANLLCDVEGHPSPTITWILPHNRQISFHNSHLLIHKEHTAKSEIDQNIMLHKRPSWHNSGSYRSDIENHPDRIIVLQDGSLYIDYIMRSDAGPYSCVVQNSRSKFSINFVLRLNYEIITEVKIMSLFVGLACAASFFMLNLIYAFTSALARRCINQRRRDAILKLLENLDQYKSSQMGRLRENYNGQLQKIRDTYHQRLERISTNYTSQVSRLRQGASHLREGASNKVGTIRGNYKSVRDNYNNQLGKLRDYSSHQLEQLRDMYSNQVLKIRDYGSLQLGRFHHKYKLQQKHVIKLLEMMNVDNCRTVFDTECVQAESMILSDPNLDPAILSPVDMISVSDEEYVTATSESSSRSSQEHLACAHLLQNEQMSGEITASTSGYSPASEEMNLSSSGYIPDKPIADYDVDSEGGSQYNRPHIGQDSSYVNIQMIDGSEDYNMEYDGDYDEEEEDATV
ncbi:leucine-rich repeats and immunoglobulin-like domains protein 3 [Mizuhopecten yessoensis]|uniref:leucine-rich repeats and immunoglobulin-like domains protein 3 n=1 Tax=Mizuhopecten yessoensis TaxID=6573 RepID=UPI000B45C0FF|nr:leucine-rich repeats and immunoglobulin-like domains protein 3 [Mizuhopecten yessoensis]XP_021364072.1 leucine-rich repeats and immunoglobulin-like domains protein 3 [Mizuhopecten yessoensis]XP_021364073.1 leucine-rich repeats and immunoglobulin-like domains protein 3 [Mizuhopecten yessoensis]XP_021364074.1 leucine-rich repeats and immunoglobulin-like domains protein 3 [Mizuhopecten yessoensis]